jgi:ribosomal protein S26
MAISDRIDIDNESVQVKQQRELNNSKLISSVEIPKKERRGFCTNCSIF